MALAEQARQTGHTIQTPRPAGELIKVDFRTGEIKGPHKRHSHAELVNLFGVDYRLRAAELFMGSGDIRNPEELEWLEPDNDLREHKDSDADYLVWMKSPRSTNLLAVSVMPSGKKTSGEHKHRSEPHKVVETYRVNRGECDLWIDKRDFRLREGQVIDVWPGHWHKLQNPNGRAALVSIIIGNGASYKPDELHIKP